MNVNIVQYNCRITCRLIHITVKEDQIKMYCDGTVFINHATNMIQCYNKSLGVSDTIIFKDIYEYESLDLGFTIYTITTMIAVSTRAMNFKMI